jgi:Carboxypeptidase regulatory-like domain
MRLLQSSRLILKVVAALLLSCFLCAASFAASDLSISGKVTDAQGKPLAHATVMVYHAGVTTGYNLFCPSCYADCGKRAITDSRGTFAFHHLSPGLWFELLIAKSGYQPQFVKNVIPASDARVAATLSKSNIVSDSSDVFHGRIVSVNGLALRDAVVQPIGALFNVKTGASLYGMVPGLDPIAVTDGNGTFEIAYSQPAEPHPMVPSPPVQVLASIDARGMAEAVAVLPAGIHRDTIIARDGATVRGRLVQNGKPVGEAEIGIFGYPRGGFGVGLKVFGSPYDEIRIGTQPDGTFSIPNVPVPGKWYVYAKMDSVAKLGATGNFKCATKSNGEFIDLGDLQLKPAYHLRGKVVLSDGKAIPNGMRVTISSESAFDSQTATLPPDGHFEFVGLAAGDYAVWASVKGYSPPPIAPVSVKGHDGRAYAYTPPPPPVSVKRNVDDLVITLYPKASRAAKTIPTPKT